VSTSTLGGHVNTIPEQLVDGRRRRRFHSDEFKATAVAACMQPGVSMAAVAMVHGINANLLRRWVNAVEKAAPGSRASDALAVPFPSERPPSFVPLQIPPSAAAADIRIELRRGAMSISVTWPAAAAVECGSWMREVLR
jgi:transposase